MGQGDESFIEERLERFPDVVAAYLFGSRARGHGEPRSDVDIALLLREGADRARIQLEVMAALAELVGSDRIDVVVLNDAPPSLAYRVLRDGRLLVSRDDRVRAAHWVCTVDRYLDMEPMRRTLAEGLKHRLGEARFGRS